MVRRCALTAGMLTPEVVVTDATGEARSDGIAIANFIPDAQPGIAVVEVKMLRRQLSFALPLKNWKMSGYYRSLRVTPNRPIPLLLSS